MCNDILCIFHFGGKLDLNSIHPSYNGGYSKFAYVDSNANYSIILQKAVHISYNVLHDKASYIQCLYHNGIVHTLVDISNDDDVCMMMNIGRHDAHDILLYVGSLARNEVRHQIEGRSRNRYYASGSKSVRPSSTRIKSNKQVVTAKCGDDSCSWRIHASIVESGPWFKVRTYNEKHSCSKPRMGMGHAQATQFQIADFVKDRLRLHPTYTPKEIMIDFQKEFGVEISYKKAYRGKEIAILQIIGSYEDSYKNLPDYAAELCRMNLRTFTQLQTDASNRFQRFFFSFGASIESFKATCRPLFAVDGTHLREKFPGTILVAVTHDADHKLFPTAFGIAKIEKEATWGWFFENMKQVLSAGYILLRPDLTIVSDRMKGPATAIQNSFPNAYHCYCCLHIADNILGKFKDAGIVKYFWCAAKTYRPFEYEKHMDEIQKIDPAARSYIDKIGKEHWANAFLHGRRYDMLTTNLAECTNALFKQGRELPITLQVEAIRHKFMEFFKTRRDLANALQTRITPYAEGILTKSSEQARHMQCDQAGPTEFQVQLTYHRDIVDLDKWSCSCRTWDSLGIPCSRAIAAIKKCGMDAYDFCENFFDTSIYRATYDGIVHPARYFTQWGPSAGVEIYPPRARRQAGRPLKNRIRTEDRHKKQYKCSTCGEMGHNKKRCRNPPA